MGNYATVEQVKTFKINGQVVDLSDYTDAEIEEQITLSEEIIECLTNDIFYPKEETNDFDGSREKKLYFFPRIPYSLLTIDHVKEFDVDGTEIQEFEEGDDYIPRSHWLEISGGFVGSSSIRGGFGNGGVWPWGQLNIQVKGTWGWETTPAQITRVTILLTLESLVPGSTGMKSRDVTQTSWSDFTISFKNGSTEAADSDLMTGFVEADRILRRYINYVDLFIDGSRNFV